MLFPLLPAEPDTVIRPPIRPPCPDHTAGHHQRPELLYPHFVTVLTSLHPVLALPLPSLILTFSFRPSFRGLFATHYHHLSGQHAADPRVAIMHMACAVGGRTEEEADEEQEGKQPQEGGGGLAAAAAVAAGGADNAEGGDAVHEVTFLYKLAAGVCMWGGLGGTRVWGGGG